ncbi:DNA-packaging protein [Xanthomonas phage M29]|nr:DNA-packaging protein [Xanthomonas phage M29]
MHQSVFLKLVSAIVIGGEVVSPPAIIEVSASEAADFVRRGKAVPATAADGLAPDPQLSVVDGKSNAAAPIAPAVGTALTEAEIDALVLVANETAAAAAAALAEADNVDGKNSAQRKADRKAADDAVAAAAQAAEAAAKVTGAHV